LRSSPKAAFYVGIGLQTASLYALWIEGVFLGHEISLVLEPLALSLSALAFPRALRSLLMHRLRRFGEFEGNQAVRVLLDERMNHRLRHFAKQRSETVSAITRRALARELERLEHEARSPS
jgi:hypothetical protein